MWSDMHEPCSFPQEEKEAVRQQMEAEFGGSRRLGKYWKLSLCRREKSWGGEKWWGGTVRGEKSRVLQLRS